MGKAMITVNPEEMAMMLNWAKAKFGFPGAVEGRAVGQLRVVRHGYHHCTKNKSIEGEVIIIGKKKFARGLATHADCEILVRLPSPGKVFKAFVGRDQNILVKAERADFVFSVEVGGKEVWKSKAVHGGENPIAVSVPLNGAMEFTLKATGQKDWAHAAWGDAHVILQNGQRLGLDELPFSGLEADLSHEPPFSFTYDGQSSRELMKSWTVGEETRKIDENRTQRIVTYRDPRTLLEVTCEATIYHDYPAVEWVVYFKNAGELDSPILENVQAMDAVFRRCGAEREFTLLTALGSDCAASDFQPKEQKLNPKETVKMGGVGGRSSTRNLPFMNIMAESGGAIMSVGWTGQWAATFTRNDGADLTIQAGLERTHFRLHAGERVRGPRMLLLFWKGERVRSQNMLRQFILDHYTPRPGGKQLQSPITRGAWGMVQDKIHLKQISKMLKAKVPFDYYWIDAGWYGDCQKMDDWWGQAGNWFINRRLYPKGFKPLSDLLHKHGKGLLLWFDCERAYKDSRMHKEHPEWLIELEGNPVMLFNLGIPEAREWLTNYISGMICEEGVDCYRQDSNIDPLEFWKKNDAPDRQGISEMKHIEGLYIFWDELLRRHPNLVIDNCSSGGRRIDLEMTKRSVPLWRSDLQCSPWYSTTGSQAQTLGLSQWVPLHSTGARETGSMYDFRSAVSSGFSAGWAGIERDDFPIGWMKKAMSEAYEIRDYHYGNFYPLTSHSLSHEVWMAYQLDRPDWGKGIVLAYRREECPYPILTLKLQALEPKGTYEVNVPGAGKKRAYTGQVLMTKGIELRLEQPRSSVVISYRKMK